MGPEKQGLYGKYRVERSDGRPLNGGWFVLELGDRKAWPALLAYADAAEADGNTALAADLRAMVDKARYVDQVKSVARLGREGPRLSGLNKTEAQIKDD